VFAAASLTESFDQAKTALTATNPRLRLSYSFAGSQALPAQIDQGAPADVFASADDATMRKLVDAGLVDAPVVFARNRLAIAVAPGNPKHVVGLADLARPDVGVVLEDPSVPAGAYAAEALARANVRVRPRSSELDVKSALAKVTGGEADATIVYVTDLAAASGRAAGVDVPDGQNVVASYPIAVVKSSRNRGAARAFVHAAVAGPVHDALLARGFLAAP